MNARIRRGLALARREAARPWRADRPRGRRSRPRRTPARAFAVGDPQTSLERFLAVLDRWGLLDASGGLADDAGLVAVGDYFDYAGDREEVAREGTAILRWLAAHPAEQIVLLAGNHDLARVIELAGQTDEGYARARERAEAIHRLLHPPGEGSRDEAALQTARAAYLREFPDGPAPRLVRRDLAGFLVEQRETVQALLLAGRLRLGCAIEVSLGGRSRTALATHAGFTRRDREHLGAGSECDARALAARLDAYLAAAVARVRPDWEAGRPAPLDLSPLHRPGRAGHEGGGLLYHRPANPAAGGDDAFEADSDAPRRFDPRDLPPGLDQICGHAGHRKCLRDLGGWAAPSAAAVAQGGLRTILTDGRAVRYEFGILEPEGGRTALWMIDGEMNRVDPATYPLLPLSGWD